MRWGGKQEPPMIMGILNVTPDSFSDGGRYLALEAAVEHAQCMFREGADILDIGGESTRPGSHRESAESQIERVVPVIAALRDRLPRHLIISVDTTLAEVAEAALNAGADMVNDISAGRDSSGMFSLVASRRVPIVLMHMQGTPETMQQNPHYDDVLGEVETFLRQRVDAALAAGIGRDRILLDPGIGFGKRLTDNLDLLAGLTRLAGIGFPLLLGTSRKGFMGRICEESDPAQLVGATCATTAFGVGAGVRVFRVHDVKANRQAARLAWAMLRAGDSESREQGGGATP